MADSVDPDQTESDLDLCSLPRHAFRNKYL